MDKFIEMQAFVAVAEAGSFVKAAEALDVSKAVDHHMRCVSWKDEEGLYPLRGIHSFEQGKAQKHYASTEVMMSAQRGAHRRAPRFMARVRVRRKVGQRFIIRQSDRPAAGWTGEC